MIDKVFKRETNRLNYIKPYRPEKCPVLLSLPYVGEKSTQIERNIKKMTEKVYRAVKPMVIFTSRSVLSPKGKYLISNKEKCCVVYIFECCCSNSYIGQTSKHLETIIKEHVRKCVREHIINQPKIISIASLNAMNRSSIAEHLIKNPICGKSYNELRY